MPPSAIARSVSVAMSSGACGATHSHAPRVLAQQEQQLGRPRKLRRVAEAAAAPIERHLKLLDPGVERVDSGHCRTRRATDHQCP